ncbi:hypothetical protein AJ80_00539 [Polytolypa hystricis UAMH7299]|uniref:Uncharacterized protein n=1 Tax=Polytolypa hystricis (strain UAMH7299) TaxID=1447883 RepID=A0A2B7Z312_POLH7|nr:hypothetical protein AJ80_00539 [Polytolypa hystricis UAMH7299]
MCRPGVDQTERTMPELTSSRDFNFKSCSWGAWPKLARPVPLSKIQDRQGIKRTKRAASTSQPSVLESLPPELLWTILEDPDLEKEGIIALGVSSTTLFQHVVHHIQKACSQATMPMAFFLIRFLPLLRYQTIARDLNWRAFTQLNDVQLTPAESWKAALADCDMRTAGALRDLTTKKYVRYKPRADPDKGTAYIDDSARTKMSLDDFLMQRIYWTRPIGNSKERLADSQRPWAGHCFDIVLLDNDELRSDNRWKDITSSSMRKAIELQKRCVL